MLQRPRLTSLVQNNSPRKAPPFQGSAPLVGPTTKVGGRLVFAIFESLQLHKILKPLEFDISNSEKSIIISL